MPTSEICFISRRWGGSAFFYFFHTLDIDSFQPKDCIIQWNNYCSQIPLQTSSDENCRSDKHYFLPGRKTITWEIAWNCLETMIYTHTDNDGHINMNPKLTVASWRVGTYSLHFSFQFLVKITHSMPTFPHNPKTIWFWRELILK